MSRDEADQFADRLVDHRNIDFGYLYLGRGPALFSEIAASEFYYPNQYERDVLRETAREAITGRGLDTLVDVGAGGSDKFGAFLPALQSPVTYVPCDFSDDFLADSIRLASALPSVGSVHPVRIDLRDPEEAFQTIPNIERKAILILGSTICNFSMGLIRRIVASARAAMNPGDRLVITADQPQPVPTMLTAYDDPGGLTARFNLHLLDNLNARFGLDLDASAFRHASRWNPNEGRVEMHLVATRDMSTPVGERVLHLTRDESLMTEWSYKFTRDRFSELLRAGGLDVQWVSRNAIGPIAYVAE